MTFSILSSISRHNRDRVYIMMKRLHNFSSVLYNTPHIIAAAFHAYYALLLLKRKRYATSSRMRATCRDDAHIHILSDDGLTHIEY